MTALVYSAIAAVTKELSVEGISKDRKTEGYASYKFRGIDDIYNALSPVLARNKLCILPNVIERSVEERVNTKGTTLFYVTVKVRFDFVSAEDASKHEVFIFGEAMDSGDKATNKAMSAAYKYAAMQTFCIPTEGDNDADSTTHEVRGRVDVTDIENAMDAATSVDELLGIWNNIPKDVQKQLKNKATEIKNKLKGENNGTATH